MEAHARAVAASVVPRATKGIPGRTMDMLTQELMFVLEGSDGAAERCAAMESLFWLQVSPLLIIPLNGEMCSYGEPVLTKASVRLYQTEVNADSFMPTLRLCPSLGLSIHQQTL